MQLTTLVLIPICSILVPFLMRNMLTLNNRGKALEVSVGKNCQAQLIQDRAQIQIEELCQETVIIAQGTKACLSQPLRKVGTRFLAWLLGLVGGVWSLQGVAEDLPRVLAGWKNWGVRQSFVGRHVLLIKLRPKGETFVFYYEYRIFTMLLFFF